MIKKTKITIGIPAHNEQNNIGQLLKSILLQQSELFEIEKVIVLCDGCRDKTADIVREFSKKYKFIKIVDDDKRVGKSERMNQLFSLNKSEILITFDADVVLLGNDVINELVRNFKDSDTVLVCGSNMPVRGENLFQKITCAGDKLWYEIRKDFRNGNNVYNNCGSIQAIKKSFTKNFRFPKAIVADQHFIYFKATENKNGFRFAQNAVILYRPPDNLKDYLLQATRSLTEKKEIIDQFSESINKEYEIPSGHKFKVIIKRLLADPIFTFLAILLAIRLRLFPKHQKDLFKKGIWVMPISTKKAINLN